MRISEESYRTIYEEFFDGLFVTSPGGKLPDMNKKGIAMCGYDTKEEVLRLAFEAQFSLKKSKLYGLAEYKKGKMKNG